MERSRWLASLLLLAYAPLQECQAKVFDLNPELVRFSDSHIYVLVSAHVYEYQESKRFTLATRFGVVQITVPEAPLKATSLSTKCWRIPESFESYPQVGHPGIVNGVFDMPSIFLDTAGTSYTYQLTNDWRESIGLYQIYRCPADAAEWTLLDGCLQLSGKDKLFSTPRESHRTLWRERGSPERPMLFRHAQGEAVVDQKLPDLWSDEFARLASGLAVRYGIFQAGDGLWCYPPFEKDARTTLTAAGVLATTDFLLCPLDGSPIIRRTRPVVAGAVAGPPVHVYSLPENRHRITFQVVQGDKNHLMTVEYANDSSVASPVIQTDHSDLGLGPTYYFAGPKVLAAVDLTENWGRADVPLGKRSAEGIDIHFWNPTTGEHVVREIYLGSRFWYETTMDFHCARP